MGLTSNSGGSDAGAIRAGRAFVSLGLKQELDPGLNDAKRKLENFNDSGERSFHKTESKLNKAFAKFTKQGGLLGSLGGGVLGDFGLGGTAAIVTGLILGAQQLAKIWIETSGAAKEFNSALEKADKLNSRVVEGLDRRLAAQAETLEKLGNDPSMQIGQAVSQISQLRKELDGSNQAAEQARKTLKELDERFGAENLKDRVHFAHEDKVLAAKKDLELAEAMAGKLRDRLGEVERKLAKLREPGPDLALTGDIKQAIQRLEKENDQRNMSPGEKLLDDLRRRESSHLRQGGKQVDLTELENRIKLNELNLQIEAKDKAFEELKQRLQDNEEFAGRTADEVAVLKARRESEKAKAQGKPHLSDAQISDLVGLLPGRLSPLGAFIDVMSKTRPEMTSRGGFAGNMVGLQFGIADSFRSIESVLKDIVGRIGQVASKLEMN